LKIVSKLSIMQIIFKDQRPFMKNRLCLQFINNQ